MRHFMKGDIVRIRVESYNNFHDRVAGYDAQLTRLVMPGEENYDRSQEKWHFRMLAGPMKDRDDYYCIKARNLTLRQPAIEVIKPPTKGLPML